MGKKQIYNIVHIDIQKQQTKNCLIVYVIIDYLEGLMMGICAYWIMIETDVSQGRGEGQQKLVYWCRRLGRSWPQT